MSIVIDLEGRTAIVTGAAGGVGRGDRRGATCGSRARPADPGRGHRPRGAGARAGRRGHRRRRRRRTPRCRRGRRRPRTTASAAWTCSSTTPRTPSSKGIPRHDRRGVGPPLCLVMCAASCWTPGCAADRLPHSRGTMVNVASVSGVVGTAGQAADPHDEGRRRAAHAPAGGGVLLGRRGVRVNAVGSAAIDTEFVARSLGLQPGHRPCRPTPRAPIRSAASATPADYIPPTSSPSSPCRRRAS